MVVAIFWNTSTRYLEVLIPAFLEESDSLSLKQPQAATSNYQSKSGGILDAIQGMQEKNAQVLSELRTLFILSWTRIFLFLSLSRWRRILFGGMKKYYTNRIRNHKKISEESPNCFRKQMQGEQWDLLQWCSTDIY